jgi:hypothetical protein
LQFAKDGKSETIAPPGAKVAGFEDAGMGRTVQLEQGMELSEVVKMVKEHLNVEHGQSGLLLVGSRLNI